MKSLFFSFIIFLLPIVASAQGRNSCDGFDKIWHAITSGADNVTAGISARENRAEYELVLSYENSEGEKLPVILTCQQKRTWEGRMASFGNPIDRLYVYIGQYKYSHRRDMWLETSFSEMEEVKLFLRPLVQKYLP